MIQEITLELLEGHKALSSEQLEKLREYLKEGKNIIILGAFSTGKTTLARALMLEADTEKTEGFGEIQDRNDIDRVSKILGQGKNIIATMHFSSYPHLNMPGVIEDEQLSGKVVLVEMVEDRTGLRKVISIMEK